MNQKDLKDIDFDNVPDDEVNEVKKKTGIKKGILVLICGMLAVGGAYRIGRQLKATDTRKDRKAVTKYIDTLRGGNLRGANSLLSSEATNEINLPMIISQYDAVTVRKFGNKYANEAEAYLKETTAKWISSYKINKAEKSDESANVAYVIVTTTGYRYSEDTFTGESFINDYTVKLINKGGNLYEKAQAIRDSSLSDSKKMVKLHELTADAVFAKMRKERDSSQKTSYIYTFTVHTDAKGNHTITDIAYGDKTDDKVDGIYRKSEKDDDGNKSVDVTVGKENS